MDDALGPSVPFEKIGPGQSIRLVYQVLGSNGPISNPARIRYLAPGDHGHDAFAPTSPASGPLDVAALIPAVQFANLGLAVANLAISAAVLVETKKQTRMLREMHAQLRNTAADVRSLLEKTDRVDVNVAQVQLRYSLRYAVKAAAADGGFDLIELNELVVTALRQFFASTGGEPTPGTHGELSLSSDLRALCEAILGLFWAARLSMLREHNQACDGNPRGVVADDLAAEALGRTARAAMQLAPLMEIESLSDDVFGQILGPFRFVGIGGDAQKMLAEKIQAIKEDLGAVPLHKEARGLLSALEGADIIDRSGDWTTNLRRIEDFLGSWAAHSDAGLLWSLATELRAHSDADYWSSIFTRTVSNSQSDVPRELVVTRVAAMSD